jgi:serine protease
LKKNKGGIMKKIVGAILICITLVLTAIPAFANPPPNEGNFVPGEIIVKFKNGVDNNEKSQIYAGNGLSMLSSNTNAGFQRLKVSQGRSVLEMADILNKNPNVEYAEPNYIAHAFLAPNDPYYSYQWHLHDQTQGGINMQPAWDISTGSGTVIAIIDTGIKVGTDLVSTTFVTGYDFVNNDNDPTDDNGHGTHVAGTIAQNTNNGIGVAGVAFGASLMAVKVLDSSGSGTYTDIVNGIYYAVDHGAKIISMSLGGTSGSQTLQNALAYAYNNGVTCVAASGNNNGPVSYPAAYDAYVIAVGATRYDKTRAYYSNYGSSLDVVAPGGDLNVDQNGDGQPDGVLQQTFSGTTWGYYWYSGTSMATPHVSGVAALLYSHGITSPNAIRAAIQNSAIDLGTSGWDKYYGYGLINAYNALTYIPGNSAPTCTLTANPTSGVVPLTTTFSMTATDTDGTIASWALDINNDGTAEYSGSGRPPATQTHTYSTTGTYTAKLTVVDDDSASGFKTVIITVTPPNTAPKTPTKPTGPTSGSRNKQYTYSTSTTDPDGNQVYYWWDWGDGTNSGWLGPYNSGETKTASHKWTARGTFLVKVKAKDIYGAESGWSATLSVTIK